MDLTDVLQRVLSGDRRAYAEIVARYEKPLFGFFGRMGLPQARAEDIAQETFLRAWMHLGDFDPGRASFTTWLYTIARRAIWLFLASVFVNVPWLAVVALFSPGWSLVPLLLLTLAASIAIWVFGMRDAFRQARARQTFMPAPWQTSGLYVLVLIVCNVVTLPVLTMYVRAHFVQPFRIPSVSMEPSVLRGDYVMADKRYNCPSCKHAIARGDVTVFVDPNDRTLLFIKRIVALPGDSVQLDGTTLKINGRPLSDAGNGPIMGDVTETSADGREWRVHWDPARPNNNAIDLIVPAGQVYVLGDNRSNSLDSRALGPVPMQDVVGRARQIWFSIGADGVRWRRLGLRVR
jgi:signal peptidase I